MAEFDLTARFGPYLDRHLIFPLLEFLPGKGIYDEQDLLRAKLDILAKTHMVDFATDIYKALYSKDESPIEFVEKRASVVQQFKDFSSNSQELFAILSDTDVSRQIQSYRDSRQFINYITDKHNYKPEMSDILYNFAKFQYECGNYSTSAEYLYFHRLLVPPSDKNYLNGLWGKLASEVLMQNWDTSLDDLNRLREFIENNSFGSALQSLQQRTWLIHWSLFVFFNHPKGRDLIIDMFLYHQVYLNAIQTICPHILRYLATAVITNKTQRNALKDLVKVIQQESYAYSDPITEFLEDLYVNFDFDGAQQKLRQCELVLSNDFFLVACVGDFIENARLMIFETFCRIHECISINMLAEKLNMEPEFAERWIVNLILNAQLNAKIDSKLGHVVMGTQTINPYHQLIEKTKSLTFRTQAQADNVEKRLTHNRSNSESF